MLLRVQTIFNSDRKVKLKNEVPVDSVWIFFFSLNKIFCIYPFPQMVSVYHPEI